jgi:predicted KAP-like P-loop ATPase
MWADNETDRDFLNFTGVADTVAEIVLQVNGAPISIGVSGKWGVGKSSMIRLIRRGLAERTKTRAEEFVFVEFNAWLYQGYDDARAALLEVIASTLAAEAAKRETGIEKAQELLKRVNWLRAAKLVAPAALALAFGLPPPGLVGEIFDLGRKAVTGGTGADDLTQLGDKGKELAAGAAGLLNPAADTSPPKEIHAIRASFEAALEEMKVTLIVLIDDLDRCLPATTISTLEAIRLFLFLERTAFVIAADEVMIKHAVRRHFDGVDDDLVTSYFDKLIQVPIRVPPLGTQEVRAYLMLLFVENSTLPPADKEVIRNKVCTQLAQSWKGHRVDREFMMKLHDSYPADLVARFEAADQLAPLLTNATHIAGNPRLIKRFLNALSIRMTIARGHHVTVDESALTKMLLFERCAPPKAYDALTNAVTGSADGIPAFLKPWEDQVEAGEKPDLKEPWDDPFIVEWLALPPHLGAHDLRGILYVSREHAPLITPADRLSSEGAELLAAVLETPDMADKLRDRLARLPRSDLATIMDRVLKSAEREQEWGTPPILDAALTIGAIDPAQGQRLAVFLKTRPGSALKPSIVPKIEDQPWSAELFAAWQQRPDVGITVKKAISARTANGNV